MSIFNECTFFVSFDVKNKLQTVKTIKENGGAIAFMISKTVTHMLTVDKEYQNMSSNVKKALSLGIFVVSEQFVQDSVDAGFKKDAAQYKFVTAHAPKIHVGLGLTSPKQQRGREVAPVEHNSSSDDDFVIIPSPSIIRSPTPKAKPVARPTVVKYTPPSSSLFSTSSSTSSSSSSSSSTTSNDDYNNNNSSFNINSGFFSNIGSSTTTSSTPLFGQSPKLANPSFAYSDLFPKSLPVVEQPSVTGEVKVIAHPRTIKCILHKAGSPSEPAFPKKYKIVINHTLQMTNIAGSSNNNKYYIVELHEGLDDSGKQTYRVYTNYGTSAKKGYQPVALSSSKLGSMNDEDDEDYSDDDSDDIPVLGNSTLSEPIQKLVQLIYKEATTQLTSSCSANITDKGIETPLGVLSLEQVEKGEKILEKIHDELKSSIPLQSKLETYSSEFYTVIPHKMGRTKADVLKTVIRNLDALNAKVELLQLMKDLLKLNSGSGSVLATGAIDMKYFALKTDITPLESTHIDHQKVLKLVVDSSRGVEVKRVYKINKSSEGESFATDIRPTKLLFHGSRASSFVGILSRGMLLPKVIVNNGGSRTDFGFLGAGIYYADKFSTSCIYAHPAISDETTRFVLVSEVALGMVSQHTKINAGLVKPPVGYNSCLGVGNNGVNGSDFKDNEYVIYNTSQQRQQYLVEFSFDASSKLRSSGSSENVPVVKSIRKSNSLTTSYEEQEESSSSPKTSPVLAQKVAIPKALPKLLSPTPKQTSPSIEASPQAFTFSPNNNNNINNNNYNYNNNNNNKSFEFSPIKPTLPGDFNIREFPEETRYRELFVNNRRDGSLASNFVGCEKVYGTPAYKETHPANLAGHHLVMPFIYNQAYKTNTEVKIHQNLSDYHSKWHTFTNNHFKGFNWNNIFVAGGAVLGCLLSKPIGFEKSDIDLFMYGLDDKAATARLVTIYNFLKTLSPNVQTVRTKYAVTFLNAYPFRNVQVVLRLYKSPAEVLMGFDIDACSVGFDGSDVYALPRARRAIVNGVNCVSMTRRSLTYETRLFKYAKRGFAILVPDFDRSMVDLSIYSQALGEAKGLARLLLLESEFVHSPSGYVALENESDYSAVQIPWDKFWSVPSMISVLNYQDKTQFFSKKSESLQHRHIVVVGFEESLKGTASWCKLCKDGKHTTGANDHDADYVEGPIAWVTENPGRQLLTGSFHPVSDGEWMTSVQSPQPSAETISLISARRMAIDNLPLAYGSQPTAHKKSYNPFVSETDQLLSIAAAYGNKVALESLLRTHKQQVNVPSDSGYYPLHYAAMSGSLDCVKLLLNNGALPNLRSRNHLKFSCLIVASIFHSTDVVQYLINNHPNTMRLKCGVSNRRAFSKWRYISDQPVKMPTGLAPPASVYDAILRGDSESVISFLADPKVPDVDPIGQTLFHYAVFSCKPKDMFALLSTRRPSLAALRNKLSIYGQSPDHYMRMALSSIVPWYQGTNQLSPLASPIIRKELKDLLANQQKSSNDNMIMSTVPVEFIKRPYHHAFSLCAPFVPLAFGTTPASPASVSSLSDKMSNMGIGGKFSPVKPAGALTLNPSSWPTAATSTPFNFGAPSISSLTQQFGNSNFMMGGPTLPGPHQSLPPLLPSGQSVGQPLIQQRQQPNLQQLPTLSFGQPFGQTQPVAQQLPTALINFNNDPNINRQMNLSIPKTGSIEFPDFLRQGSRLTYDQSSTVAKTLVLINLVKDKFTTSDVESLRAWALQLYMPIFNSTEAFAVDRDINALVENFRICLRVKK
eukprot:gene20953-25153_t